MPLSVSFHRKSDLGWSTSRQTIPAREQPVYFVQPGSKRVSATGAAPPRLTNARAQAVGWESANTLVFSSEYQPGNAVVVRELRRRQLWFLVALAVNALLTLGIAKDVYGRGLVIGAGIPGGNDMTPFGPIADRARRAAEAGRGMVEVVAGGGGGGNSGQSSGSAGAGSNQGSGGDSSSIGSSYGGSAAATTADGGLLPTWFMPEYTRPGELVVDAAADLQLRPGQLRYAVAPLPSAIVDPAPLNAYFVALAVLAGLGVVGTLLRSRLLLTAFIVATLLHTVLRMAGPDPLTAAAGHPLPSTSSSSSSSSADAASYVAWLGTGLNVGGAPTFFFALRFALDVWCVQKAAAVRTALSHGSFTSMLHAFRIL